MGHDGDLIAATHSVEEICTHIGADSLAFLSLEGMMRAVRGTPVDHSTPVDRATPVNEGYCNACFTGEYPISVGRTAKAAFESALG
jgi:amidophosphoribosyltransferase